MTSLEESGEVPDKLIAAAMEGDVKAQIRVGVMYHDGEGVSQDCHQAMEWFLKAANQGVLKMIWGRCIVMEKE